MQNKRTDQHDERMDKYDDMVKELSKSNKMQNERNDKQDNALKERNELMKRISDLESEQR